MAFPIYLKKSFTTSAQPLFSSVFVSYLQVAPIYVLSTFIKQQHSSVLSFLCPWTYRRLLSLQEVEKCAGTWRDKAMW